MSNRKINLLPLARQKALEQEYWIHFATIGLVVATWLVVIAGVLLIPSYVFLGTSMTIKQGDLNNAERTLVTSDGSSLLAQFETLSAEAARLRALKGSVSVTQTVAEVLSAPRTGISLSGVVYVPSAGKAPQSVVVSGIASSRDTLHQYQIAFKGLRGVSSAELPVSAFAKDSNIPFTISVAFLP